MVLHVYMAGGTTCRYDSKKTVVDMASKGWVTQLPECIVHSSSAIFSKDISQTLPEFLQYTICSCNLWHDPCMNSKSHNSCLQYIYLTLSIALSTSLVTFCSVLSASKIVELISVYVSL